MNCKECRKKWSPYPANFAQTLGTAAVVLLCVAQADSARQAVSIQLYLRDPASAQTVISRVLAEIVVFDRVWMDSTHVTFRIPEERWSKLLSVLFQLGSFELTEPPLQPQVPVALEILPVSIKAD